ncbi:MAG: type II toxin-antitoxin system RelE/ParE family toxin [Gemmataceae bacterium]|nr:type II toxin-antitoxin system RelE/ParE family toxin [Gemmataceae bacterium]
MRTSFRKSFARDLKKIKDKNLLERVQLVIEEIEAADDLKGVSNLKKMTGTDNFYRIRIGEHRIGISVEDDEVEFVRCLPRRDLYRFFP